MQNTMIYALGDIIPKFASFIIFPILTTYLSPDDYGIISYVNSLNLLMTILGFLALNTYYLVYYFKVGDQKEQRKLLGSLTIFVLGLNLLLTVTILLLGLHIPHMFSVKIEFYPYLVVGFITNFFSLFNILPSALFRVQGRPMPLTILNVIRGVSLSIISVIMVTLLDYKALGVLYGNLVVNIIFGFIFLYINIKNMDWSFDWSIVKRGLKFSLPLVPGTLAVYLLSMSDRFFIERYLDLTQLGIYSTAATFALILNIFSYGAYRAFEPHFFQIYGTSDFARKFKIIHNNYLYVVLIMAIGLSIYAKEFFELFASVRYQEVYYYVPLIVFGLIMSAMNTMYATIITAQEKTKLNSIITIIGGLFSLIINITMIPILGLVGSCIASAVGFSSMLIFSITKAKLPINCHRFILALIISVTIVWISVYVININHMIISVIVKGVIILVSILCLTKILEANVMEKLYVKLVDSVPLLIKRW